MLIIRLSVGNGRMEVRKEMILKPLDEVSRSEKENKKILVFIKYQLY